jgi:hypothetical protein
MADLSVDLGFLKLRNPVLTASGTFGYGLEFDPFLDLSAIGGLVVKGLYYGPREGNPPPRLVETASGLINAIGLPGVGVEHLIGVDCEDPVVAGEFHRLPLLRPVAEEVLMLDPRAGGPCDRDGAVGRSGVEHQSLGAEFNGCQHRRKMAFRVFCDHHRRDRWRPAGIAG